MKQHYLFATAAIFVTHLAIAQANKTETKRENPPRQARTEQTLKVDRSTNEQPTREIQKPNRNDTRQPQTNNSGNTRKVEDRNSKTTTFSMNPSRDDKTREHKKDITTRTPNNNGNRTPQRNNVNPTDRRNNDQSRFGNNGRYNRIDRNYYPDYRRPYSFIGVRYTNFYRTRYVVPYRGMNYYYSGGFFYQPYQNYFQVIIAPIGIRTFGLPWGYHKWYIGSNLYYYYGGTYYRNMNNYYEVVEAPLGSILPELPTGATSVIINNQQYYQLNNTYYKETLRNGETWYTIVGKNGQLNTTTETINEVNVMIGDIVTELPDNSKTVILNNQKYFVSENDVYYQELIVENSLYYKVIAKPQ